MSSETYIVTTHLVYTCPAVPIFPKHICAFLRLHEYITAAFRWPAFDVVDLGSDGVDDEIDDA